MWKLDKYVRSSKCFFICPEGVSRELVVGFCPSGLFSNNQGGIASMQRIVLNNAI